MVQDLQRQSSAAPPAVKLDVKSVELLQIQPIRRPVADTRAPPWGPGRYGPAVRGAVYNRLHAARGVLCSHDSSWHSQPRWSKSARSGDAATSGFERGLCSRTY